MYQGAGRRGVLQWSCSPVVPPLSPVTYLAHGRKHHAGQVLREAADNVGNLPHALGVTHGRATELVNDVHLYVNGRSG